MKSTQFETQSVSIDTVIPYARNPRKNDTAVTEVAASIKEYGWQQPIVVDEQMVIIVGHTRFHAAKKLGYTEVPVHIAKGLSEQQVKAYRIADNRTSEYAEWDAGMLKLELEEIGDLYSGFTEEDIADLDEELDGFGMTDPEEVDGDIKFSEEMNESYNYVVLLFKNDIDWLSAQTHFHLPQVWSYRELTKTGKGSTLSGQQKGLGRVIDGGDYLAGLKDGV